MVSIAFCENSGVGVFLKENPPGTGLKQVKSGKPKPYIIQKVKL